LWSAAPEALIRLARLAALVVAGATLVFAAPAGAQLSTASGTTLLAVAGATGATKWTFTAPSGSLSSPSIGPKGNVYVTSLGLASGPSRLFAFEGPG
jgi:outer membrane protein assembly factor BamB